MAKTVDITDKLIFDENPVLHIGTLDVEVNSDAETMLLLMGVFSEKEDLQAVNDALELIFKPEDIKEIAALKKNGKKLSSASLMIIIQEAIALVMEEVKGE